MTECLPDLPRYIRQFGDNEWQGADRRNGPWRSIPAPQSGLPWMKPAATKESSAIQPTTADRLALAVCPYIKGVCKVPANDCRHYCRRDSAAVAHELAAILREHHSVSSKDAAEEVLFLIAEIPAQETGQAVQEESHG
jgi:hypothetical protein